MMTPKTDLTENLDFSRAPQRTFIFDIEELGEMLNITSETYDRIHGRERIFGKKYHKSERYRIFDNEEQHMYKMKTYCLRCGVEHRLPWRNNYGLCDKCSIELDRDLHTYSWGLDKDPWIEDGTDINGIEDKQTRNELFGLR